MRTSRLAAILLSILAAPWLPAAHAQSTAGVTGDTIKIGTFGPLTGPDYLFGKLVMNGAEIVYNEVNKAGGIHGRKLVLVREDDRCDPAAAIAAAKKLIHQEQVFMINGGGCSNAAIAARPEIEQGKLPWVVFAAVADEVTMPTSPYIFSTALAASLESYAQLDFALSTGARSIAIVSQRDAWGRSRYNAADGGVQEEGHDARRRRGDDGGRQRRDAPGAAPAPGRRRRRDHAALSRRPAAVFLRDAQKVGFKPILDRPDGAGRSRSPSGTRSACPGRSTASSPSTSALHARRQPEMEKYRALMQQAFPSDRLSVYNLVRHRQRPGRGRGPEARRARSHAREGARRAGQKLSGFETGIHPGAVTCTETDHQCHKTPAWIQLVGDKIQLVAVTPVKR